MACFLVPLAIGIILEAIKRIAKNTAEKIKLNILSTLMLGGSLVLALEHVWHGEVVPWPPFLTAMSNPTEIPVMIHEMLTAGTAMTLAVTGAWTVLLLYERRLSRIVGVKTVKPITSTMER